MVDIAKEDVVQRLEGLAVQIRDSEPSPVRLEDIAKKLDEITEVLSRPRSILDLKGVGKELWRGIDVDEYLREERRSWDRDIPSPPFDNQV